VAFFNPNSRLARHVLFFGLPLVLGLAAHALFNLVDTLLVGQLGEEEGARAISVTGLCDPITTLQTILFNGPIAGAGVILSRAFGERECWLQLRAVVDRPERTYVARQGGVVV
jgi:Na+-driven multidrug efflux pump